MNIQVYSGLYIDEKMYLLREADEVLMIDSVRNAEAEAYLQDMQPEKIWMILTHEHIDHIYGVNFYKERYSCEVICSEPCAAGIQDSSKNLAKYKEIVFGENEAKDIEFDYFCIADRIFQKEYVWNWKQHELELMEMPGHSPGSTCIVLDGQVMFSGDTILKDFETITRLPGSSKRLFREETIPRLKKFCQELMVYPGHGKSGKLRECLERKEDLNKKSVLCLAESEGNDVRK